MISFSFFCSFFPFFLILVIFVWLQLFLRERVLYSSIGNGFFTLENGKREMKLL